jgi:transposase-like protein
VLVRSGRERLAGTVEIDETYIGGRDPGVGRGKGRGDKVLTGIALEIKESSGYGRCRIAPLADAAAASLRAFVSDHVEPGATVITDGWKGYLGLDRFGYTHEARSQRAARLRGDDQAAELLPAVHRVASLAKRWILGTHQGAIEHAHLHDYLNEFVFRFNRRHSRSRGMVFYRVLELAVRHAPLRYADIVAGHRPRQRSPKPPSSRGTPTSLERVTAARPWQFG